MIETKRTAIDATHEIWAACRPIHAQMEAATGARKTAVEEHGCGEGRKATEFFATAKTLEVRDRTNEFATQRAAMESVTYKRSMAPTRSAGQQL